MYEVIGINYYKGVPQEETNLFNTEREANEFIVWALNHYIYQYVSQPKQTKQ